MESLKNQVLSLSLQPTTTPSSPSITNNIPIIFYGHSTYPQIATHPSPYLFRIPHINLSLPLHLDHITFFPL